MKFGKYLLGGLVIVLIAIQLIPNELPEVKTENPADLIGSGVVDGEITGLLKTACYDCHSNETKYPWYSSVAPVSWLVAKDTREGREEVNFSEWANLDMMDQLAVLDDIYTEVEEEHMPMPIYTAIHTDAKLSTEQRQKIMEWAEATMDKIAEEEDSEME